MSRRAGLASEARGEDHNQERRQSLERWIERQEEVLDHAIRRREAAEVAPRKVRREALPDAEVIEADVRKQVEKLHAQLREMPPVRHDARAELAHVDLVLSERRRLAITAAQLAPPDYIVRELGERPSDPELRNVWDKGVSEIEGYRQEHGIKDPQHALGREGDRGHDWSREQIRQRLQQRQAELQRGHEISIGHGADHSVEIGL